MRHSSWIAALRALSVRAGTKPTPRRGRQRLRLCLETLEDRTLLNAGMLDSTFGTGGIVLTSVAQPDSSAHSTLVQPDGKIVVAGDISGSANPGFALVRYNSDGSLDSTFGTGGEVLTPFSGSTISGASSVILQGDGKLVAAGFADLSGGGSDLALARYNSDGSLDTTFGAGGEVLTSFGPGTSTFGGYAALQSDGKLVIAGYASLSGGGYDFELARYNSGGSLDTTFGNGGLVVTGGSGEATSVALQSDGKIVVAGLKGSDAAVARYNSDGSSDAGFGTGGEVFTSFVSGGYSSAGGVAVQSNGQIVVAGYAESAGTSDFALARYNGSNGSLDNTFGTGGVAVTSLGAGITSSANGIAVQGNGQIVAAGGASSSTASSFAVARYNSDGSLDSTFGSGGSVITSIPSGANVASASSLALQSDSQIVVAGTANTATGHEFAVARYLGGVPTISTLSSTTAPEGAAAFTLTVQGTGYTSASTVQWNGAALATTFVSSTQLQAAVPAALLAEEGGARITVANSTASGDTSNAAAFTITEAPLTAKAVNVSATAGAPFNSVVATFTDAGGPEALSDYAATIAWGDPNNTSTAATIVANADGSFSVVGSFTYAAAGNYTIGVTITHEGLTTAVNAAMTVYANPTVINTHDSGPGSLRQAILDANSLSGTNTISFDIPTTDPGYNAATGAFTIAPLTALPVITDPVIIDGYSQPGASPNTLAGGDNAVLKIVLSGANEGTNPTVDQPALNVPYAGIGLNITAGSSTVRGLVLNGFSASAIFLGGGGGDTVAGNFIGTDPTGSVAVPNSYGPPLISYPPPNGAIFIISSDNLVGGTDPASRNVISGNGSDGVLIMNQVTGNEVAGNFIGADATGTRPLGNASDGVALINGVENTTIGGLTPGARNIISGNTGTHYVFENAGANSAGSGVYLAVAQGTVIEGNYIGLDVTGARALGNAFDGVFATFSTDTTVGGTAPGAGNVISGNSHFGADAGAGQGTVIQGNFIGTDATGTRITDSDGNPIGNHEAGVAAEESTDVVGGTSPGAGNLISGNGVGIYPDSCVVQGNLIGTDRTGRVALGNWVGIELYYDANHNTIGGTEAGAGNVISGNSYAGILRWGPAATDGYIDNVIQGNKIGTDVDGNPGTLSGFQRNDPGRGGAVPNITPNVIPTTGLGNGVGVWVQRAASYDLIGGTAPGTGNLIAYNSAGVVLTDENGNSPVGIGILGNSIFANNSLGIDLGGDGVTPNHASSPSTGPNNWQNYPLLTSASNTAAGTVISGTLNSVPNTTFRLEFFATPTLDASGNLEGQTYLGFVNVTTDANGNASFTATVAAAPAGQQYITSTATRLDANGNPTDTSEFTPLPLAQILPAPSSLSGLVFEDFNDDGQVDFGEQGIASVTITLTGTDDLGHAVNQTQLTDSDGAYIFLNLRPGNYYLTETQPSGYLQGIDTVGTAGGSLSATDQFFVTLGGGIDGLNYNFGEQPPAGGAVQPGQTATIGFWNNTNGQALIKSFNGGSTSTQLGDWLAATLPNTFGANAGSNDLAGKSNADIAALFQSDFLVQDVKLDAQVLATALSVYATNATLDNTGVAANYGFIVSGNGLGTATVNVGSNGAAFGVADNSVLTVMDLLKATDAQAVGGLLYNGDATLRKEANNVYSAINEEGDIS